MRLLLGVLLGLVAGYAGGVATGIALVAALSANSHDRAAEIATTSALVTGPTGALIGLVSGVVIARRKSPRSPAGD